MVHISRLRNKIEDDPQKPEYLKTIRALVINFTIYGQNDDKKDLKSVSFQLSVCISADNNGYNSGSGTFVFRKRIDRGAACQGAISGKGHH